MHAHLLMASTVVDAIALATFALLLWRNQRARNGQRATLDTLRTDLTQLLADAERRAQALDDSLGTREQALRSLLADIARSDHNGTIDLRGGRGFAASRRPSPEVEAERDSAHAGRRGLGVSEQRSAQSARAANGPPGDIDPAEARLLRDLELRLGGVGGNR